MIKIADDKENVTKKLNSRLAIVVLVWALVEEQVEKNEKLFFKLLDLFRIFRTEWYIVFININKNSTL